MLKEKYNILKVWMKDYSRNIVYGMEYICMHINKDVSKLNKILINSIHFTA